VPISAQIVRVKPSRDAVLAPPSRADNAAGEGKAGDDSSQVRAESAGEAATFALHRWKGTR